MSDAALSPESRIRRVQRVALIAGAVGLALCAGGALIEPPYGRVQFFRSYLVAFIGVVSIPLGSLAILMVHHLTGGAWGTTLRHVAEAATRTLLLLAILFVPLLLGLHDLYPWAKWDTE